MREMKVYTVRNGLNQENRCVKETLKHCQNWLGLDLDIGVLPRETLETTL